MHFPKRDVWILLKIRPFKKESDEEAFVSIFNACFGDYDDIRSISLKELRRWEEAPSFSFDGMFVAEWNGEIAGMVNAFVDRLREEKKGFVQWLAVLPKFRRKGIAKKLVEKALENLKQRGMIMAETWAQSDRKACVHLFESFGFKQLRATNLMGTSLKHIPADVGENLEVAIREADLKNNDDIALVNCLENEAFMEHFNYRPKPIEETKYVLTELPWFQKQAVFFALANDKAVGYVETGIDEGLNSEKNLKYGWILDIGILKPYRQKGIGKRLMLQGMQRLKTQGMTEALLYVDEMNPTRAIRLYEVLGFKTQRRNIVYQLILV